jgi:hypothetical protein
VFAAGPAGAGAQCDGEDWLIISQIPEIDYATGAPACPLPPAPCLALAHPPGKAAPCTRLHRHV